MLLAGGWISAGMISTVQTPLPILAATVPNDWAHFCAPSPESLMTSTMWSFSSTTGLPFGLALPFPFRPDLLLAMVPLLRLFAPQGLPR